MPLAFRPHRRSGLTLVEILIALTMTLIVLGTMITAFKFASEEMREGRALIELANRARLVEDQLRTDLERLTVETRVFDGIDEPDGYFEYIEGPIRDSTFSVGVGGPGGTSLDTYQGDCDDVLCFTARSSDDVLFRGRRVTAGGGATVTIESSLAEVIWFTTVNGNDAGDGNFDQQIDSGGRVSNVDFDDSIQLRRRVLLIRPDLNDSTSGALATGLSNADKNTFIRNNDISVRVVSNGGNFDLVANSLEELAVRANRFAHNPVTFPNNLDFGLLQIYLASDVNGTLPPILSDVGAFDLRAYSPTARVNDVTTAGVIVEPSDLGYDPTATLVQRGAYVDLGYSQLATAPAGREDEWFITSSLSSLTGLAGVTGPTTNVWDTWTAAYEGDGIDQDGDGTIDQGTNGLDNGGTNVIDDPSERETSPPYLQPIRAMKITLRLVEKGTKQIHQTSIFQSFVPE